MPYRANWNELNLLLYKLSIFCRHKHIILPENARARKRRSSLLTVLKNISIFCTVLLVCHFNTRCFKLEWSSKNLLRRHLSCSLKREELDIFGCIEKIVVQFSSTLLSGFGFFSKRSLNLFFENSGCLITEISMRRELSSLLSFPLISFQIKIEIMSEVCSFHLLKTVLENGSVSTFTVDLWSYSNISRARWCRELALYKLFSHFHFSSMSFESFSLLIAYALTIAAQIWYISFFSFFQIFHCNNF